VIIRQPAAAAAVAREMRARPDVVYSTGMYTRSALMARAARRPLVLKLASDPAYERARRSGRFAGTLEAFQQFDGDPAVRLLKRVRTAAVRSARRVLIPSRYLAEIAAGWGIDTGRVEIVPNPAPAVDGNGAPDGELRASLAAAGPLFVFAGRLTRQKNLPLAVAAAGRVPGASLVVVGEGPERERLEAAVATAGLRDRVHLLGARPRAAAVAWLRAADAAVLPSDWENFPHAAVEALAVGTPVIATAVGGVPEIVEPGVSGLLVPPGDEGAFAAAMSELAADEATRRRMGAEAERAAARFRPERTYAEIERQLELAAA
jgi:glycosyltransferase involved in cell wall biosynthesis